MLKGFSANNVVEVQNLDDVVGRYLQDEQRTTKNELLLIESSGKVKKLFQGGHHPAFVEDPFAVNTKCF